MTGDGILVQIEGQVADMTRLVAGDRVMM